jgi:hypothetical protein
MVQDNAQAAVKSQYEESITRKWIRTAQLSSILEDEILTEALKVL